MMKSALDAPEITQIWAECAKLNPPMTSAEGERFKDFYDSNGWKVSKNPMKNWLAALRNWHRNSLGKGTARNGKPIETCTTEDLLAGIDLHPLARNQWNTPGFNEAPKI